MGVEAVLKEFRELFLKETLDGDEKKRLESLRKSVTEEMPDLAEREEDRILAQELRQWLLKEKQSQNDSKEDE